MAFYRKRVRNNALAELINVRALSVARPELTERKARTILLTWAGWTARKPPATGYLDSLFGTNQI
jgi:hypothetical protein